MRRKLRRFLIRRRARAALRFLKKMDQAMGRRGYNSQQKKQAWQDFIKSPASRDDALGRLYGYYTRPSGAVKMAIPKKREG